MFYSNLKINKFEIGYCCGWAIFHLYDDASNSGYITWSMSTSLKKKKKGVRKLNYQLQDHAGQKQRDL